MKNKNKENEKEIDQIIELIDDCKYAEDSLLEARLSINNLANKHFKQFRNLRTEEFDNSLLNFEKCINQTVQFTAILKTEYKNKFARLFHE